MNLADIKRRVIELVPGLSDVKITQTDDKNGLYFVCMVAGKLRCVFAERLTYGAWVGLRTDEAIANEIAKGLRA